MLHKLYIFKSVCVPFSIIILLALFCGNKTVYAQISASEFNTKTISHDITFKKIDRIKTLELFFEKYKSPLKEHAATFVSAADEHKLDFKLLPAISCIESSCGKVLIPETYNPFGWGIYGNQYISFESYAEAIGIVAKGLSEGYVLKGVDTIEKIARIYTPSSTTWAGKVHYFSDEIEQLAVIQ